MHNKKYMMPLLLLGFTPIDDDEGDDDEGGGTGQGPITPMDYCAWLDSEFYGEYDGVDGITADDYAAWMNSIDCGDLIEVPETCE